MTRELDFGRKPAASGDARSMVVFLHGYGADGADLLGLADPLATHLPDTVFIAPDAPEACAGNPFGRQWFPIPWLDGSSEAAASAGLDMAAADIGAFLDARLKEDELTNGDCVLFGFSQGSMMALQVGARRLPTLAGIVAFSGRLLRPDAVGGTTARPPVLLVHGDQDQMVPFADMGAAGRALDAAGFAVRGFVMRGTGHGIAPDGLSVAVSFLTERLMGA